MKKILFALMAIVFAVFAGCQKKDAYNQNKFRVSFHSDPLTLDARKSGDITSATLIFLLFNGLTELQPNASVKLALADSYQLSDDRKVYTFHLRNCYWSNGSRITAHDFEYSWKKVIDPAFPSLWANLFYPIKNAEKIAKGELPPSALGAKAADSYTFIVELEKPFAHFLELISFCTFFPVNAAIDQKDPNWSSGVNKNFVCSGPFLLKKWQPNNEIIIEKNLAYWNAKNVLLDAISISIIHDENTALEMFDGDKLDCLGSQLSPLPLDSRPTLLKRKDLIISPIGGTVFCSFNIEKPPFCNQNIRKAFSLAINRKTIVKNVSQLDDSIATRCIPPILMENTNRMIIEDNNLAKAREYFQKGLAELKLKKEDLNLIFSYGANLLHKKQAEVLADQWQKAFDIPIQLEQNEEKVIIDRMHRHDYQFALRHLFAQFFDPLNVLERFKHKANSKNYPAWENPEFTRLLNLAERSSDQFKRIKFLEKAEDLLAEEMPIAPIYHYNYALLKKPRVKNLGIGPVGNLHFDKVYLSNCEKNK